MKTLDVMTLAWKLFRGVVKYTFRYCLVSAWRMSRKVKVSFDNTLNIKSKELKDLSSGTLEVHKNTISINDSRDYELLFYFLKYL